MALRIKFLSPTCVPDLKDIDTYFFFEKIFRSDIRICVTATSVWGFSDVTENLKKYLRIQFFQKKIVDVFIGTKSNLVCTRRQSGIGLDRHRSGQN